MGQAFFLWSNVWSPFDCHSALGSHPFMTSYIARGNMRDTNYDLSLPPENFLYDFSNDINWVSFWMFILEEKMENLYNVVLR